MASNNPVGHTHNRMLDQVSLRIENKLHGLPQVPPKKSIFKVHNQLRMVNEKAYEPECVAIGPYHHYNDHRLHYMEEQKLHFLQKMLQRRQETTVDRYVQALGKIEVEVRQQYVGIITLAQEEFIEMMLLNGYFIIECFRNYILTRTQQDENDSSLSVAWINLSIRRDLLLLENQLPFNVLRVLYNLIRDDDDFVGQPNLVHLAQKFLFSRCDLCPRINHCKHLLDLVYQEMIYGVSQRIPIGDATWRMGNKFKLISSATDLKGSGIKFKSIEKSDIFNIQFNKGTLEIPTISVKDDTEAFFRNLVAYEQNCQGDKINYVSAYLKFMACLVNTPEDVGLLRQKGVIDNNLGDDEVVSMMFNKIGNQIVLSNFYYESIFNELNKHCRKRRNRWIVILKKDYFHSPWALLSVLAAIMLLLLSLIQTVYTVISFYKGIK